MPHAQSLATNTLWNALERFSTMGIQLVCTFLLGRFLTPADFGLVGMLVVFTLIGNTLTESGFSQALIREERADQRTLSTVFWTNLVLSLLVYTLLYCCAPLIASFYHQPALVDISRITFLVIPLNALSLIHFTLFQRELQFRPMCLVSVSASLVSCTAAILWAWQTQSVWALVLQNVLAYALRTLGYWLVLRWHPSLQYSFQRLRQLFAFSSNLLITGLLGNVFNNIYTLLIGRYYGATQAGYFVQADRIRIVASASSTQVVQSVSYPVLSRINHEGGDLRTGYQHILLTTLLLVGFFMTLLVNVSEDLMQLLMGSPAWRVSGQYLVALGIAGILYPLHAVNQNILMVKGLGQHILWLEVSRRAILVLLLIIGLHYRVELFVWTYALYSFLLIFLNLRICGRPIGYTLRHQLHDIWPILSALGIMLVVGQCSNHILSLQNIYLRLCLTLLISVAIGYLLIRRTDTYHQAMTLARITTKRG